MKSYHSSNLGSKTFLRSEVKLFDQSPVDQLLKRDLASFTFDTTCFHDLGLYVFSDFVDQRW